MVLDGSSPAQGKVTPHLLIAHPFFLLSFCQNQPPGSCSPSSEGLLESHPSQTPGLQAATRGPSNSNVTLIERIPGLRSGPARFSWSCRHGSHFYNTKPVSVPWHKHLRGCCSGKGRSLSDLWLIHSSSSCQANITLSEWSMWHSITPSGCDRTSPFPLPSLRAISDIASLLLHPAVYFSCLHSWIPYIWVSLSGSVIRLNLSLSITLSFVLKTLELLSSFLSGELRPIFVMYFLLSIYISRKYFNGVINYISILNG